MSTVLANIPADFFEVGVLDERLTAAELETLSLFEGLRRVPNFVRFPGSSVLRKCVPGQIMCRQGEAGASAFYILTDHDVLALRQRQLTFVDAALQSDERAVDIPARIRSLSRPELQALQLQMQEEIATVSQRQARMDLVRDEHERDELLTVTYVSPKGRRVVQLATLRREAKSYSHAWNLLR